MAKDYVVEQVKNIFPMPNMLSCFDKGDDFSDFLMDYFCNQIPTTDKLYLEVPLADDGTPRGNGFNCNKGINQDRLMQLTRMGFCRPDFIIGPKAPRSREGVANKTWFVGELKSTLKTLYDQYRQPSGTKIRQFDAIINYAGKHTYSHAALFICAIPGKEAPTKEEVQANVLMAGVLKHTVPVVVIISD